MEGLFADELRECEHLVEGRARIGRGPLVDRDLVHDTAGDELLERPHEMWQIDPVHRRAVTDRTVEEHDLLVRMRTRETAYQIQLGTDGPGGSGRRAGRWMRPASWP